MGLSLNPGPSTYCLRDSTISDPGFCHLYIGMGMTLPPQKVALRIKEVMPIVCLAHRDT